LIIEPPYLDQEFLLERYGKAKRRLILFDYDGTLSPICKTPEEAKPLDIMLAGLEKVVRDPLNVVFIISGRDQDCLDNWLGHIPGLGLRFDTWFSHDT
jgi:trehalose 6-phosphate synthase/phosphatase